MEEKDLKQENQEQAEQPIEEAKQETAEEKTCCRCSGRSCFRAK